MRQPGRIHAANPETSDRLKRFLDVLKSARCPLSTRTMQISASVCNPNTCAAELRQQGYLINVEQKSRVFFYSYIGEVVR